MSDWEKPHLADPECAGGWAPVVRGHSADGRQTHIMLRHAASQGWEGRSAFHEVSRT